jgi:hypothetical protein
MSDMMTSICVPGEPARILRVTVTDEDGTVLASTPYEVPAGTEFVAVDFEHRPSADDTLTVGSPYADQIRKAIGCLR